MRAEECYSEYLSGNDDALVQIVGLFNREMIYFILGYMKNPSDAEDVAADTFLELIMKKPHFSGDSSFKTWLFKIARNKAIDRIRKNKVRTAEDISELTEIQSENDVEEDITERDEHARLYRAIQSLLPDYRDVLHLLYFCDMSYTEAAKVMGKNEKQITNLAYRARNSLKEALEKENFR